MTTFVDTSALYALLAEDDRNHGAAAGWMRARGADPTEELITHSYVVVESLALVHRRLGGEAVRALTDALLPALTTVHVDESLHRRALAAYRSAVARRTSFVDHVSFEMMRDRGMTDAFAFDRDFDDEGLRTVP